MRNREYLVLCVTKQQVASNESIQMSMKMNKVVANLMLNVLQVKNESV